MPRFLGKDFYKQTSETQRKCRQQASLDVPDSQSHQECSNTDSLTGSLHKISAQQLLNELTEQNVLLPEEELKFNCSDNISSYGFHPETLEWQTVWKIINGELLEVVPSSNPESFSSSCNDEILTPIDMSLDFQVSESFTVMELPTLEETTKQLEEPILQDVPKRSSELSEALQLVKSASFENPLISSVKEISERTVFGRKDQYFDDENLVESPRNSMLQDNKPNITPNKKLIKLQQDKAEELLSPICTQPSQVPPPPQYCGIPSVVKQAQISCRALTAFSTHLLFDENKDYEATNDFEVPSIIKNETKAGLLEKMLTSPVTTDGIRTFVDLNGSPENITNPEVAELDPPVELPPSQSPLLLSDKYLKIIASRLKQWSPNGLSSESPFLKMQEKMMLENSLRHTEQCLKEILLLKLKEPETGQCLKSMDGQSPVGKALQLVHHQDVTSGLGKSELNLSWDISAPERPTVGTTLEVMTLPKYTTLQQTWENPETPPTTEILHAEEDDFLSIHSKNGCSKDIIEPNYSKQIVPLSDNGENKYVPFDENQPSDESSKEQTMCGSKIMSDIPGDLAKVFESHHFHPQISKVVYRKQLKMTADNQVTPLNVNSLRSASSICGVDRTLSSELDFSCDVNKVRATSDDEHAKGTNRDQALLEDFDLHYDDEEFDVDTDSTEDVLEGPHEVHLCCDEDRTSPEQSSSSQKLELKLKHYAQIPALPTDAVDSFVMMRKAKAFLKPEMGNMLVDSKPSQYGSPYQHQSVLTPMSALPKCLKNNEEKNLHKFSVVSLSGMYAEVCQLLMTEAEPLVLHMIQKGVLQKDTHFSSLRSDYTRFLLKEHTTRLKNNEILEDDIFRELVTVHTLRVATDLLKNCCFESTVVYMGNMQEKYLWLSGRLDSLRKEMFRYQFMMQQTGVLHPKIAAVCREIQEHTGTKHCLIVVTNNQPSLMIALQTAISSNGNITLIADSEATYNTWPSSCSCLITWKMTDVNGLLSSADLVIEFEADRDSCLYKRCQAANVPFVGLCMDQGTVHSDEPAALPSNTFSVIGSETLIAYQDLLHLLEARYSILVLPRHYSAIEGIYFADILLDFTRGIVLLDANQFGQDGVFEKLITRVAGIGLHLSHMWILLYNLSNSPIIHRKITQLQGLLSTLSRATEDFNTSYKVIFCSGVCKLAATIHKLTKLCEDRGSGDQLHDKHIASFLSHEMSSGEKFLLGIPCLNSFRITNISIRSNLLSAQLLTSRAAVGELMIKSVEELVELAPELPIHVIKNMHRVLTWDSGLKLRLNECDSVEDSTNTSCASYQSQLANSTESDTDNSPPAKLYCPSMLSSSCTSYDPDSEMRIVKKLSKHGAHVQHGRGNGQQNISSHQNQNNIYEGEVSVSGFPLDWDELPSPSISNPLSDMDAEKCHHYRQQNFPESLAPKQTWPDPSGSLSDATESTYTSRRDGISFHQNLTGMTDSHTTFTHFPRQNLNKHEVHDSSMAVCTDLLYPKQRQGNMSYFWLNSNDGHKRTRKYDACYPTFTSQMEHGECRKNVAYFSSGPISSKNSLKARAPSKMLSDARHVDVAQYPRYTTSPSSDCPSPHTSDRFSLNQFELKSDTLPQSSCPSSKTNFPQTVNLHLPDLNARWSDQQKDTRHKISYTNMPEEFISREGQSFTQDLIATTRSLLHAPSYHDKRKQTGHWRYPHRVSIGLAQPLRREPVCTSSTKNETEVQELVQEAFHGQPAVQQQQNSSPPIDLVEPDSTMNKPEDKPGYISVQKLQKWSDQLRPMQVMCTHKGPDDYGPNTDSEHSAAASRKFPGRLAYTCVSGTGGQTKLVFQ